MKSKNLELLTFKIEGQNFAFPLPMVERVIQAQTITRIEKAPEFIEGVIDIKGEIIGVISLRKRFSLVDKPLSVSDLILIINYPLGKIGVIADKTADIIKISEESVNAMKPIFEGMSLIDFFSNENGIFYIFDTSTILSNIENSEIEQMIKSIQKA
jgi:purine-binding chemotaxis protein CheW